MNVLALDLSLTSTGVCLPDGTAETLTPAALSSPPTFDEQLDRIAWIVAQVSRRVALVDPTGYHVDPLVDLVALEGFSFASKGSSVDQIYGLGWAVRLDLHRLGVPFVLVPPSNVKQYATGSGQAKKPDLRMELFKRTGIDEKDDNRVDSIWLRAMTLDHYGDPVVQMPAANRAALAKVAWPALSGHTASEVA